MKPSLIILFVLFYFFSTNAQSRYLEGYLITNEGDTLRGYIQDKNNKWSIQSIQFSKTPTSAPTDYSLSSFKSMYIKEYNEHFTVQTVNIDKKPIRNDDLETVPARKIVSETILLRLLVSGKIYLFRYTDENGKIHFFIQKDDKPEELGYVRYFAGGNLGDLRFYIGTLQNLTADCDKVKITKPDYTEKDLVPIITRYNSCYGEGKEYIREKEKMKISVGLIAGGKLSFYNYNGVDNALTDGANNIKFSSAFNPVGGFYLDFLPRSSSRFVPGVQVLYQESGAFEGSTSGIDIHTSYKTNFRYITTGIFLKSFLNKRRNPPFFAKIGAGYNQIINHKADAVVTSVSRNVVLRDLAYAEFKYGINLHAGIGLSFSRITTEIRFQEDMLFGKSVYKGTLTSLSIMVGYKLF